MNSGGKMLHDSVSDGNSPAGGAVHSGRVGLVHDNTGAVTFCQREYFCDRSDITLHAENAFRNNQFAAAFQRVIAQAGFERVQIEVRIDDFPRSGKPHAVDHARMIQRVGENQIFLLEERGQQTKIRGVAAAKIKRRFGSSELRKLLLQLFPDRGVPGEQS